MNYSTGQMNGRNISFMFLLVGFLLLEFMLNIGCSQTQSNMNTAESISWQRQFDDKGRVMNLTDAAGRVTRLRYSDTVSGKTVVTKTSAEGVSAEFDYNDRGLITVMKDALGIVSYQYDTLSRLIRVQRSGVPAIQYKYDSKGRILRQSIGDFYALQYTYDFLGRVSTLDTPAGTIAYDYQLGQGMVIRTLSNGVKTIWTFGVNGQIDKATHIGKQNVLLIEFRYQYRADGLLDAVAEKTRNGEDRKSVV